MLKTYHIHSCLYEHVHLPLAVTLSKHSLLIGIVAQAFESGFLGLLGVCFMRRYCFQHVCLVTKDLSVLGICELCEAR